jgi:hypothetical protein
LTTNEPALLFQPLMETPKRPAGLVEIRLEVKGLTQPADRRFIVQYTCPWMGGHKIIAYGYELQLTT